jgi:tetraacyldisaccharide 4'-kinase
MVEYLLKNIFPSTKAAVLSRGYRRKSKGFVLADKGTTVEQLGDEPYQIYSKFKGKVPVAVEGDRVKGIQALIAMIGPEVIVLDDAYQHRKVTPLFSVLLTSYGQPYYEDCYLPTGNLRDSKSEAKRANVIVVTKCPEHLSEKKAEFMRVKLSPGKHQIVLFASLHYGGKFVNEQDELSMDAVKQQYFTLVTGIADYGPLVEHLRQKGLNFEHLAYGDHHFFSEKELAQLKEKELIITTEKDYMRLKEHLTSLYYMPVQHEFLFKGEILLNDAMHAAIPLLKG